MRATSSSVTPIAPGRSRATPRDEWVAPSGARLTNTGCWVHEPSFLGSRPHESPYRVGFAVALDDDEAPRLLNLLDSRQGASPGMKQTA